MAIVSRTYLLDGNVTIPMVERYLPAPLTSLKVTNLQTACVVEYDDVTVNVVDLDAAMSVFGYIPGTSSTVTVRSPADLPSPVGGVITLAPGTAYEIQGVIDVSPSVIVLSDGTTISGRSPATDQIHSHQPSPAVQVNAAPGADLVATISSVQIVNGAGDCVDFQGDAFVFLVQCGLAGASAGRVSGLKRFAFADSVIQSCGGGWRIEGANNTLVFSRMQVYDLPPGVTVLQALTPATVNLMHIADVNIVFTDATQAGFDLDEAIAGAGNAVAVLANVFVGPGTPLVAGAGKANPATSPSPPWRFGNNVGIADSP